MIDKSAAGANLNRAMNFRNTGLQVVDPSQYNLRVHMNAQRPAALQQHAYAQGGAVHLGTGQQQHLGHEASHVVQQRQGR